MFGKVVRRFFSSKINYQGLERWGIKHHNIQYNLSVPQLYESGLTGFCADYNTFPTQISSAGAMVASSGTRYGRSPKEKRVVFDNETKDKIWWHDPENACNKISDNKPITPETNKFYMDTCIKMLNSKPKLYVVDGYLGWDPEFRLKIRCVLGRAYHALFMRNMTVRPTKEELARDFANDENIDYRIFNAGDFAAPIPFPNVTQPATVQANFTNNTYTVIGSQYAGEMKKGLFTIMHYHAPLHGGVSLHCSATEGKAGDVTLFFGLSGTGKTTLSADPKRFMLGDDEHVWSKNGVSNLEGGCYAKCINLSEKYEPDIFRAIKFGCVLENVVYYQDKKDERIVKYKPFVKSEQITENTRACYPLEHIPNAKLPSMGGHAKNVVFLTFDAFGVLPPIAKLTDAQAEYQFITGYTSKVAGTEMGIIEPVETFSTCFGAAFLALKPTVYADMLKQKMKEHGSEAWLVNTGYTGGGYGVGKRMDLPTTRKLVDAINEGALENCEWETFPHFGFKIPKNVPGVPTEVLNPRNTWSDKEAYDKELKKMALKFHDNFKKSYEADASEDLKGANPKLD